MFSLRRESDNEGCDGNKSIVIYEKDTKLVADHGVKPRLGAQVKVINDPLGVDALWQSWWQTTDIVEILEETDVMVRFKTGSGSVYVWKVYEDK